MAHARSSEVTTRKPQTCGAGEPIPARTKGVTVVTWFRHRGYFCPTHRPTSAAIAEMAPKSRADRAGAAANELRSAGESAQELADTIKAALEMVEEGATLDADDLADWRKTGEGIGFDFGEVSSLADEMRSWVDNLESGNLGSTSKHDEVEDCASTLEGIDEPSVPSPPSTDAVADWEGYVSELEDFAGEAEDKASEVEGVDFPGMY